MNNSFQLNAIGQIHISIENLPRAVSFYRDVLGMRLLFEVPAQEMAFFDCGGIRLYLAKPEAEAFSSRPLIYYRVPSIQAAFQELKKRGVTFTDLPHLVHRADTHELWLAAFRDSEGNLVHLMDEVKTDGRKQ